MNTSNKTNTPSQRTPRTPWLVDHVIMPLILPVATIKGQWRRATLLQGYLAHVYGLFIAGIGMATVDLLGGIISDRLEYDSYYYYGYYDSLVWDAFSGEHGAIDRLLMSGGTWFIIIELFYVFSALGTMCWGASPGRWRTNFKRSLIRWYQLTPWQSLMGLVIASAFVAIELGSFFMDESWAFLIGGAMTSASLLLLFVTLRGLAVRERPDQWAMSCRWPMLCESCGYALAGQTMDQDCPECGRPVAESAEFARGRLIQTKPFQALVIGATQPGRIGQWLYAFRPVLGAGQVLGRSVGLMMLTAPLGIMIAFGIAIVMTGEDFSGDFGEMLQAMFFGYLFTAGASAASIVGVALLLGSIVGTFYRLFHKRAVMHLAGTAVGYLSGILPLWLLGNWVLFGLFAGAFAVSFMSSGPGWFALLPLVWLLYNLGFALLMMFMVGRVLRATRWANV
ncbi:MAG: hypothetical protein AAGI37_01185 [Planctomycetota bacterium]